MRQLLAELKIIKGRNTEQNDKLLSLLGMRKQLQQKVMKAEDHCI